MRIRRRVGTIAAGLALVLGGASAGLLAGATSAAAAEPVVIGSCAATVSGAPGTPISLSPSAVTQPILDVLAPLDLLGLVRGPVKRTLDALPPIPIGAIQTGNGFISGGTIAKAVTDKLPVLGALLKPVTDTLTSLCAVTTKVVNTVAEPVQEGGKTVGEVLDGTVGKVLPRVDVPSTPGQPGQPNQPGGGTPGGGTPNQPGGGTGGSGPGGGVPGVSNPILGGGSGVGAPPLYDGLGRVPRDYYGGIPVFAPGLFSPSPAVRYGGAVPGYTPEFGILGAESPGDGVQAAGHAEAIGGPVGNRIALPVLLAVLILSGVTAALVRTWVLRRTTA